MTYPFKLIRSEENGLEEKAAALISDALSRYLNYPLPVQSAAEAEAEGLEDWNLILVGTPRTHSLLSRLVRTGAFSPAQRPEGYSLKVMTSPFDSQAQLVIIAGFDDRGVLYGAADFAAYYIPWAESTNDHMHYFRDIFRSEKLPEYSRMSAPAVKQRGIWTWGHVIYDYRGFLRNMARLKLNTLIVWNDYVPQNIREIIREAHSWGIRVYMGFSWGWNEARREDSGLNIADDETLAEISRRILRLYDRDFASLNMDGIYFQSFTETNEDEKDGVVIAQQVTRLVNRTAEALFTRNPALKLMFGLHATSVADKLEYIRQTDKRIMIVWEDCGAFPYAYTPDRIAGFGETCGFSRKIATLRGQEDRFGIVSKGQVCLDWVAFRHMQGSFMMGCQSEEFIRSRTEEKERLWKTVDAWWVRHAGYARELFRLLHGCNPNVLITALVEDGMLERRIHLATALFAEMLWDPETEECATIHKIMMRGDVHC